jgi:hypothetical protein
VSVCGVEVASVRGQVGVWIQEVVRAPGGRDVNWDEIPVCCGERDVLFDVLYVFEGLGQVPEVQPAGIYIYVACSYGLWGVK